MKRRGFIAWGLMLMLLIFGSGIYVQESGQSYDNANLIRLHVIANSDTLEDQALKYKIRDKLVEKVAADFSKAATIDEARALVLNNREQILTLAREEVKAWGKEYPVTVAYGDFYFPTKSYGSVTLPAGQYEALKVVIGQGKGQNWWCVLFPPLCFVDITSNLAQQGSAKAVMLEENNHNEAKPKIEYRFKILEIIHKKVEHLRQVKPERALSQRSLFFLTRFPAQLHII